MSTMVSTMRSNCGADNQIDTELPSPWSQELLAAPSIDLHTAASLGLSDRITECVHSGRESLNHRNSGGWTPLMYASSLGHCGAVQTLIGLGAKVDLGSVDNQTPLMIAASYGFEAVAKHLIARGADLEARNSKGQTALFVATAMGQNGMVGVLLDKGSDVDVQESAEGLTPLMEAATSGHELIANLLLGNSASTSIISKSGLVAKQIAMLNGKVNIANLINGKSRRGYMRGLLPSDMGTRGHLLCPAGNTSRMPSNPPFSSSKDVLSKEIRSDVQSIQTVKCIDTILPKSALKIPGQKCNPKPATKRVHIVSPRQQPSMQTHVAIPPVAAIETPTVLKLTPKQPRVTDLQSLFETLQLSKYLQVFSDQEVDLATFATLNENDLKEIGITLMGPRRKMWLAITKLKDNDEVVPGGNQNIHRTVISNLNVISKHVVEVRHNLQKVESTQKNYMVNPYEARITASAINRCNDITSILTTSLELLEDIQGKTF